MYDNTKPLFNCAQRGHQNFLESYTYFIVLLFTAGLQNPLIAAVAGVVHCAGRIVYAISYESGDPTKRARGAILIYPSLLTLLGQSLFFAYGLYFSK
jgi:glutathione S-transferase